MKELAKQISELLFEHDCVIVPGLGGFITVYKPAFINHHNNTFYPPSKQVTFNEALTQNDGILIAAYAGKYGLNFNSAKALIEEKIKNIRITLLKEQNIELHDIGTLSLNKESNIEFIPSNALNYLGDAFGLPKLSVHPIHRSSGTVKALNRPVVRKTMRWAAILIPIAAVTMWTTFHPESIDKIYNNYASVLPSAMEEVSASKSGNVVSNASFNDESSFTNTGRCISPSVNDNVTYTYSRPESLSTTGTVKTASGNLSHRTETITNNTVETSGNNRYYIIAGAFGLKENAIKFMEQLKSEGFNAELTGQNRRNLYLVSITSLSDKASALTELQNVHHKGYSNAWLLEKVN
jgi:hypothetical protein